MPPRGILGNRNLLFDSGLELLEANPNFALSQLLLIDFKSIEASQRLGVVGRKAAIRLETALMLSAQSWFFGDDSLFQRVRIS